MPQETNLNVAPYFDDFTPTSNYYKVLFKPGLPVQARELTTMQSILQNQIEDVGNHLFKEGSVVIPGATAFRDDFYCIQIDPEFLGVPVSLYLDQLVGKTIRGSSSGCTAKVVTYITDKESERGNYTLYINYEESGNDDGVNTFFDNEVLRTTTDISYATTFIAAGEGFANTLTTESNAVGMAFQIGQGVYFLRGYFVDVHDQVLILDQYSSNGTWRIGLNVDEDVISSDIDPSLTDNAQGFNNFTAPGADRLRITATLTKKGLNELNDANFVEITRVKNGALETGPTEPRYNHLGEELAKRTWDESGHYYCKDFTTTVRECLNDGKGNRGIYSPGQLTEFGTEPADNLMVYKISPGKAYVRGYKVDKRVPTLFDVQKPRTVKTVEGQSVNFGFGPSFTCNNFSGSPIIGFDNSNTLSLRSGRVGSEKQPSVSHVGAANAVDDGHKGPAGKEIGICRIYDFALESGDYNSTVPTLNQWDLSTWDLQVYTDFTLNAKTTLTIPTKIEGQSSGASAYLRYAVSAGVALTAYDVQGNFFPGERLTFNGIDDNDRYTTKIVNYEISDIASFWSSVDPGTGTAVTFTADLMPKKIIGFGAGQAAAATAGDGAVAISTITAPGQNFAGIVTTGDLIRYKRPGQTLQTINVIKTVNDASLEVAGLSTVTGVYDGGIQPYGAGPQDIADIEIVGTQIQKTNGGGNLADNESLYSIFPKQNVESVDLVNSNLIVRRQFNTSIAGNITPQITAADGEVFLPFDTERYTLIRSDGTTEPIASNKMFLTNGSKTIQFMGLGSADTDCKLVATIRKSKVTSKTKILKVSNNTLIDKSINAASGIGGTTLNDGLTYSEGGAVFPYGTRVQDEQICLNVPDVVKIYGIYEAIAGSTDDPASPSMVVGSLDGPTASTNDLIIGEEILGESSGARGIYLVRKSSIGINFVYLNNTIFEPGEEISFSKSKIKGAVSSILSGSVNITSDYTFETGQRPTFYGYSSIVRKPGVDAPSRKLKVYFARGTYDSSDTGDITTVNSYNGFNYAKEITRINGNRVTDLVDARPRVGEYSVAAGARSPFEYLGRSFDDSSNNGAQHSAKYILANDESMSLGFSYYLPRVDRVYVDSKGFLQVVYGTPADEPRLPEQISGAMNVANVFLPPYLYNTSDAKVKFIQYKRYQMADIAKLEQRIKNIEYYTSLNTVESDALNKFIPDANGLNRFKSGIFVDNFTSIESQDTTIGVRNAIDKTKGILRPAHYSTAVNLQIGSNAITGIGQGTAVDSQFATIEGTDIRKSGRLITLDYKDELYQFQPYATRVESVTPFLVMFWGGNIELSPDTDVWIDVTKMQPNDVMMEGSFQGIAQALGAEVTTGEDGRRMGVTPVMWNSWETVGVNMDLGLSNNQQTMQNASGNRNNAAVQGLLDGINVGNQQILDPSDSIVNNITATGGVSLNQQRTGTQQTVMERIDTSSLGERVVNRDIINFMRSREIQFVGKDFKPYERVYAFFDGVDVTKFCTPKLLQIEMISGTFRPGETVDGRMPSALQNRQNNRNASPRIVFRTAISNHLYGPWDNPGRNVFSASPYNREVNVAANYSSSSTTLNVDTWSLASDDTTQFFGYVASGMILQGRTTGARARITDVKLIPNNGANIIGCFHVPESDVSSNPIFETGNSTFRLTGSPTNTKIKGTYDTAGETTFYSQGDLDSTQETTLSLRNATVRSAEFNETQTIGGTAQSNTVQTVSGFDVITNVTQEVTEITEITNIDARVFNTTNVTQVVQQEPRWGDNDPIAQTFTVNDLTGIFVTKCDVYFSEKTDTEVPVVFQIRTTQLGTPTEEILPYSEVTIHPRDINVSDDATVATTITMKAPVYLEPETEYALVMKSKNTDYKVWISRLGEADVRTLADEAGKIIVSQQPVLGSLFKSQNASVWTPSQYEDLKFDLYRADFKTIGSANFYNPELPRDGKNLPSKGITIIPNKVRVSIGGSVNQNNIPQSPNAYRALQAGNTVYQGASAAVNLDSVPHGSLVGFAGSIRYFKEPHAIGNTSSGANWSNGGTALLVTNPGTGYTPASGKYYFQNVSFTSVTGSGSGAVGFVTVSDGQIVGAGITSGVGKGGTGYQVGDVLTADLGTVGAQVGEGLRLTVIGHSDEVYGVGQTESGISAFNELVITDVQGDFDVTGTASQLWYIDSVGLSTQLNGGTSVNGKAIPKAVSVVDDGYHLKIHQRNHGMYNSVNQVTIEDVESDITPTACNEILGLTETTDLSVQAGTAFTSFEGLPVSATNPGYIQIGDEVIKYTGISGNTLTTLTRAIGTTNAARHEVGDQVWKYEFGGVSLLRINSSINEYYHDLGDASITSADSIEIDSYHIKIDMGNTNSQSSGYILNRSSANSDNYLPLKFNSAGVGGGPESQATYNIPYSLMIPKFEIMTPTGCKVTARARTVSGASVNGTEPAYQDKGFTEVAIGQKNYFDTPRLVASRPNEATYLTTMPGNKSLTFVMNMAASDRRLSPVVNLDHCGVTFVNNRINRPISNFATDLRANQTVKDPDRFFYVTKNIVLENPATTLQVILDAYVPDVCDVRVFYAINQDLPVKDTIFIPFPGYKNKNTNGEMITPTASDGQSDQKVPKVDTYVPEATPNLMKEYTFSTEDLPPYSSYRIKIVGTSTNAAVVPQIQRLRATALA